MQGKKAAKGAFARGCTDVPPIRTRTGLYQCCEAAEHLTRSRSMREESRCERPGGVKT
jgi:hypothetical protein